MQTSIPPSGRAVPARRWAADRSGMSAVEFALLAPVLLMLVGAVVDVTRFVWHKHDMLQALRAGVQYALGNPGDFPAALDVIRMSTPSSASGDFAMAPVTCSCGPSLTATLTATNWALGGFADCAITPCTGRRRYASLGISYAYRPLFGGVVGVLPDRATASVVVRIQ